MVPVVIASRMNADGPKKLPMLVLAMNALSIVLSRPSLVLSGPAMLKAVLRTEFQVELEHVPPRIIADTSAAAGAGRRIKGGTRAGGICTWLIPAPSLAAIAAAITIAIAAAALAAISAPIAPVAAITAIAAIIRSAAPVIVASITRTRRRNGEQGTQFTHNRERAAAAACE
jgi:hypothetical protein